MADEPWDELMGPSRKGLKNKLQDEDPTMSETSTSTSSSRMPSRWAQYEADSDRLRSESHEANCKAVDMAAEKITNSPPRSAVSSASNSRRAQRTSVTLPTDYDSDDNSAEYGWENDEAIRAEAMKMLEIADDHLSTPYAVRKTQSGGFSASYSGGFGGSNRSSFSSSLSGSGRAKHVPKALAGLDFTKRSSSSHSRASYTASPRSSYSEDAPFAEADSLVDVVEMESTMPGGKKESKWSSRYSIDHTLLALSGGRTRGDTVKDVLDQMERETDRERKTARNMFISSPHEMPKIFGSTGFSFRDNYVFGKQNVNANIIHSQTNLKTAFDGSLDTNGKSLAPPEPRKTWQEQVERKKRQQRRLAAGCIALCLLFGLIIGFSVRASDDNHDKAAAFSASGDDRGDPEIVFYVTSDSPYDSGDEQKLLADLEALPSDAQFLVHLGNIQNSAVTLCAESRYGRVKDVLLQSPVPLFILPGEEDWNNCPNPEDAWESWETNFGAFETNFGHSFTVNRQLRRKENFAFVEKSVLFLGFHLVGGRINNEDEWGKRLDDNINWLESMVTMNSAEFKYIVMMGNARPGPQQRKFFDRLSKFLGPYDLPIVYIHGNSGVGGVMQYELFGGDDGIEGLQIEDGGKNPPLRISIFSGEGPFVVG